MSISALFRNSNPYRAAADAWFDAIVAQSRQPAFYAGAGVPDTLDGRFDLLVLHAVLVLERLRGRPEGRAASQALLDRMFSVLDVNLREMGVQDVGIGRRIKVMAEGFNGRFAAYRQALAAPGREELAEALRRNVFAGASEGARIEAMLDYVGAAVAALQALEDARLMRGSLEFPVPSFPDTESADDR